MKRSTALSSLRMLIALWAGLTLTYPIAVRAADAPAEMSKDGLQLKVHTKQRLIYVRPGAKFSQYDQVMILNCYVAMQKDWEQNYNSSEGADLSSQVTNEDVQRITSSVAAQFKKVFATELQKGGYQVTSSRAPDVLLLRPAIIDLVVTAPDIMSADMDTNVITSAGSGTLYLELWDPSTDTILARAIDAEADQQPFAQQANAVTNQAAADIILKNWADDLVRHLDAARGKPPSL